MTTPGLELDEHSRIEHIINVIAGPSYVLLRATEPGQAAPVAEETFRQILATMLKLQQAAIMPTDAAFHGLGGPNPTTMGRFWRRNDLSRLPLLQLRRAVDAGMLPPPTRLIVDARTQVSTGPEKFGVHHLRPPNVGPLPGVGVRKPRGAPNTRGGIATAVLYADCNGVIVPAGAIPIAQGFWDPATWTSVSPLVVEQRLRDRALFDGTFVTAARDVAREIRAVTTAIDSVAPCTTPWDNVAITSGRLRLGFPVTGGELGVGTIERYLGCDLDAVRDLAASTFDVFLELPQTRHATQRAGCFDDNGCDWTFATDTGRVGLDVLEDRLLHGPEPWRPVPPNLVRTLASPRHRIFTFSSSAYSADVPDGVAITLVMAIDARGVRELYLTNLRPELNAELVRIVGLVVAESERRRRDSAVEHAIRCLLTDCHLQTNQRVRHPDRQSFAGMAQAAYSVRLLANVA